MLLIICNLNLKDQVILFKITRTNCEETHAAGGAQRTQLGRRENTGALRSAPGDNISQYWWCELRRASEQRIMGVRGVRRAQKEQGVMAKKDLRPARTHKMQAVLIKFKYESRSLNCIINIH
jgi:hypothetical protein